METRHNLYKNFLRRSCADIKKERQSVLVSINFKNYKHHKNPLKSEEL